MTEALLAPEEPCDDCERGKRDFGPGTLCGFHGSQLTLPATLPPVEALRPGGVPVFIEPWCPKCKGLLSFVGLSDSISLCDEWACPTCKDTRYADHPADPDAALLLRMSRLNGHECKGCELCRQCKAAFAGALAVNEFAKAKAGATVKHAFITTYTGLRFTPLTPSKEQVRILDVAHALSNLTRFTGHCRWFYSVAEHSVFVSRAVENDGAPPVVQLAALLHDATEAYLVDVPSPIKPMLAGYKKIERGVEEVIRQAFRIRRIDWTDPRIKHADRRMLATESRALMHQDMERVNAAEPYDGLSIVALEPGSAKSEFLNRFHQLNRAIDLHFATTKESLLESAS